MAKFPDRLLEYIRKHPGLSDRELTIALQGRHRHQAQVNQAARQLEGRKLVLRRRRSDGRLGNYPAEAPVALPPPTKVVPVAETAEGLSEDELKRHLERWLTRQGWQCRIAWGKAQGIDIEATKGEAKWIIEVKGLGSRPEMRVNYFLGILGATLQRMSDPAARYGIALPDVPQYRKLWARLPPLARQRTRIFAFFVSPEGRVSGERPPEREAQHVATAAPQQGEPAKKGPASAKRATGAAEIERLKTPEALDAVARDAEKSGKPELAAAARKRAIDLRVQSHAGASEVERECLAAIYAYEELLARKHEGKRVRAARTWQMVKRRGVIGAAERAVNRRTDAAGYTLLAQMGLQDLAFEAVVLRHPGAFSKAAVERCRERLTAWGTKKSRA